MAYRTIVLPTAETDLEKLDPSVRRRALRRLVWLRENAPIVIHHRMSNLPEDLAGLCRLRVALLASLVGTLGERRRHRGWVIILARRVRRAASPWSVPYLLMLQEVMA